MRTLLVVGSIFLVGCSNAKTTQRPAGPDTPTVREFQSRASREREAATTQTAELPVEGNLVR